MLANTSGTILPNIAQTRSACRRAVQKLRIEHTTWIELLTVLALRRSSLGDVCSLA